LLLNATQEFVSVSVTQAMRNSFYVVVDSLIVFYVASRSVNSLPALRDVIASYCVAMLVVAPVAVFEFGKSWLLYSALDGALGLRWDGVQYLGREGLLRATGPAGHSLVLGYALAVGLGLWLCLQQAVRPFAWWAGVFALSIGLIAPVSRGPWVGAVLIVLVAAITGQRAGSRTFKLLLAAGLALVVVAMTPYADKLMSFVPFIGDVDESNVSYRQRILDVSWMVILENPFFGTPYFLSNPLMEQLRQGQGIIDLVNSYIVVALFTGLVGLFMFMGVFGASVLPLLNAVRRAGKLSPQTEAIGRSLLAVLLGVMFMIATVSSILSVPTIYWSLCALALAYTRLTKEASAAEAVARRTAQTPAPGYRQALGQGQAKGKPIQ
jgi:O-antigen ligase